MGCDTSTNITVRRRTRRKLRRSRALPSSSIAHDAWAGPASVTFPMGEATRRLSAGSEPPVLLEANERGERHCPAALGPLEPVLLK